MIISIAHLKSLGRRADSRGPPSPRRCAGRRAGGGVVRAGGWAGVWGDGGVSAGGWAVGASDSRRVGGVL
jgi:hypothetical protein